MEFSGLNHRSHSFIQQINVKMPFNTYEQDKLQAQLSCAIKSGPGGSSEIIEKLSVMGPALKNYHSL